jgi:hypothetical protein
MNSFFVAILIGLTLLAVRMWYTRRGESVSEAARARFSRGSSSASVCSGWSP